MPSLGHLRQYRPHDAFHDGVNVILNLLLIWRVGRHCWRSAQRKRIEHFTCLLIAVVAILLASSKKIWPRCLALAPSSDECDSDDKSSEHCSVRSWQRSPAHGKIGRFRQRTEHIREWCWSNVIDPRQGERGYGANFFSIPLIKGLKSSCKGCI